MKNFNSYFSTIIVTASAYVGMIILRFFDNIFLFPKLNTNWMIVIGVSLVAAGIAVRMWASHVFVKARISVLRLSAQKTLVVTGPYKYSRNPLYIGIILITLGTALLFGTLSGLIFTALFFFLWNAWIKFREEPDLEKAFGNQYREYQLKVNRWI